MGFSKLLRLAAVSATLITQGTLTAQTPGLSHSVAWNNAAVTFIAQTLDVTDTASAAGSLLARWRVGGVDKFVVSKAGAVTAGAASFTTGAFSSYVQAGGSAASYPLSVKVATNKNLGVRDSSGLNIVAINDALDTAIALGISAASLTVGCDLTVGASTFVVTAATGAVAGTGIYTITNKDGFLLKPATLTDYVQLRVANNKAISFAIDDSTGGTFGGAGAYGLIISHETGTAFAVKRGSTVDLLMASDGSLTTLGMPLAITGALTGVTTATLSQYIEGTEMAAPAAPAANKGRIFFQDNGAGKTQLMCIFASGAAQQLAIEP